MAIMIFKIEAKRQHLRANIVTYNGTVLYGYKDHLLVALIYVALRAVTLFTYSTVWICVHSLYSI